MHPEENNIGFVVEKDNWGEYAIFEDRKSDKTWDEVEVEFHQIKLYPKLIIRVSHKRDMVL